MRLPGLIIVALAGLGCAHAQVTCPWLTGGTAATALGGTPELTVKLSTPQEGSCVFLLRNETAESLLDITVSKVSLRTPGLSCPAGSPTLVGVGNNALICHPAMPSGGDKQLVLSQVRDLYFGIVLTEERKDGATPLADKQTERIAMIAEQVAGNLF